MSTLSRRIAALEQHRRPTTTAYRDWIETLSLDDLRFLRDVSRRQRERLRGSGLVAMDEIERTHWVRLEQRHAQFVAQREGRA